MNPSKLKGCAYKTCPLCGVSTDIDHYADGLAGRIDDAYDIISQRNDMIYNLQEKIHQLTRELAVARGEV